MSEKNDPLSSAFELTPLSGGEIIVIDAPNDETESYDMETARQNMHHLLQKGNTALDAALDVAIANQTPQSFEAATKLIKVLADVNKDLVSLQEKKKALKIKDESPQEKVVNQNLFVGSTSDLMAALKEINKNK